MNTKKSLQNRIRGWFPNEPHLPQKLKLANTRNQGSIRTFLAQSPLGLKVVVALFWIFGLIALLMVLVQFTVMGYLPFDVKVLIATVTAADGIAMIVVGGGLLTVKKRWIDTAIVFCAVSIVIFYVIPLRFGLPLELIAIAYLVILRKGLSPKLLNVLVPVALAVVICSAMIVPVFAQSTFQINSAKTLMN